MLTKLALIAILGAGGALARYGLGGLVYRITGGSFPYGTFVVNMIGCFLFGLIWPMAEERLLISSNMRMIILVGFMGSFTTFSSLVFETGELMRDSQWAPALANMGGQVVVGLIMLYIGLLIGRSI
ncbi:MAG: fluoride efflux transporter CrcB [Candidatus Zixiibacteriota bacterium]